MRLILAVIIAWAATVQPAQAYIDPGTGGYVYSLITPLIAFAGAGLAFVFRPVRSMFGKLFSVFRPSKRKSDQENG